ncbi:ABC transporter ATP-binding protein [Streptomyces anulatus]
MLKPVRVDPMLSVLRSRGERWWGIAKLLPYAGAGLLAASLVVNIVLGLLPLVFIVAMSVLMQRLPDAMGEGLGSVGVPLALAAAALVGQQLLAPYRTHVHEVVVRRVDGRCVQRVMGAALRDAPIGMLEDAETLDLLGQARSAFEKQSRTPGDAAAGLLALVSRYAQLTGSCVLVAIALGPWAGVVVAVTALVTRFGQRGSLGRFAKLFGSLSGRWRRMDYIRRTASGKETAKEIRVFGLSGWFRDRHDQEIHGYLRPLWEGRRRLLFLPFVALSAVGLAGGALALLLLAGRTADNSLSVLELAIAVQGILIPLRFGVYFPESDVQTQYGMYSAEAAEKFERLAERPEYRSRDPRSRRVERTDAPGNDVVLKESVRFEDVVFRYDSGVHAVIDHLDLEIEAGRSTAVVGLNGAGKSTLVKLLTRLHDPESGTVRVDGTDLKAVDPEAWRRSFAVIFQDYNRYELSVAENIRMGAPDADDSPETLRAMERAVDRAGARPVLDALADGWDTVLSSQYRGGRDLSGGQWQRIALARALFAVEKGARVLVLDEPTAQLDVRAEVEFFDRFLGLTEGLTSVIISHRFSTVRRADRIVVLEDGKVAEQGTHEELLALGGRYHELFHLQASRFEDDEAVRPAASIKEGAAR